MTSITQMQNVFSAFQGREDALKEVTRYHTFRRMMYRSNLWMHSNRLSWIITALAQDISSLSPEFNERRAQLMAAVHDDYELVLGDVMFGAKQIMTQEERDALERTEKRTIHTLAERSPKTVDGYDYEQLMMDYFTLSPHDIDAVIVKYIDKMDAYCEAWHELEAGNAVFTVGYSPETPSPIDSYHTYFSVPFAEQYPIAAPLLAHIPYFSPIVRYDIDALVAGGTPHTRASIERETQNPHYNIWKGAALTYGGKTGRAWLTDVKEQ